MQTLKGAKHVFENLDLKEFTSTAIDSSYDGLASFRAGVEESDNYMVRRMSSLAPVLRKRSESRDPDTAYFTIVSASSDGEIGETFEVPFVLLKKMNNEDFRPWKENSIVRITEKNEWSILLDYASNMEVVVQEVSSGALGIYKITELEHYNVSSHSDKLRLGLKGSSGILLNEEQAKNLDLPVGSIVPFEGFRSNPGGEVLVEIANSTSFTIPYGEAQFIESQYISRLVGRPTPMRNFS